MWAPLRGYHRHQTPEPSLTHLSWLSTDPQAVDSLVGTGGSHVFGVHARSHPQISLDDAHRLVLMDYLARAAAMLVNTPDGA